MNYVMESNNKFMQAAREITEHETNPKVTVELRSLVDLTEVEAIREAFDQAGKKKPTYTAFVIKSVAKALKEYPHANRRLVRRPWLFFLGPRLQTFKDCDISVAAERSFPGMELISLVDIIRKADQQTLSDITDWLSALGKSDTTTNSQWGLFHKLITRLPIWLSALIIRLPVWFPGLWTKYRGGSVLITSPAKYGADQVAAHWTCPLGFSFGLVKRRPVVVKEQVVPRPTFYFLLHFDRRVMHGSQGTRFFQRIVEIIENAKSEMSDFQVNIGQKACA